MAFFEEKKEYNLKYACTVKGYRWYSNNEPKAYVVICHGMAEHIERYHDFAEKLVDSGFEVYGHNQRGHKDTYPDEELGYIGVEDHFDIYMDDAHEIIKEIKREHPKAKVFIFGHSMGSFVTQRFIENYGDEVEGAILCGTGHNPDIALNLGMAAAKDKLNRKGGHYKSSFINSLAFGTYNNKFEKRTEYDWLNRKQDEVDKYIADPYCGFTCSVDFFYDFFEGLKKIGQEIKQIPHHLPILMISGSMDPVGNYTKGTDELYKILKKAGIHNVDKIYYEGARHEILLEQEKDKTVNDVIDWLNKKIK